MGWTTGKDAEAPGKFAYELWSDTEILHRVGGHRHRHHGCEYRPDFVRCRQKHSGAG